MKRIRHLDSKSIVIVGMMGCGKTAIGRITAHYLGLPFFDADEEIEKAAGMSVTDIFSNYGEAEFRAGECKVIARLLAENQSVLALGGGAFLTEETRANIADNGVSVWLRADLEVLFSRVMRRPTKRPLLQSDNPRELLSELLEKRKPFYEMADLVVDTSVSSKNITRDRVIAALSKFAGKEN
ncbi:MAG: shikimate kinase [Hyphomicrobiales bacterium]|nr:shikimate kinase [Hyphomicrobiales bacterium]